MTAYSASRMVHYKISVRVNLQFTRAIRKIALSALSAALQLFFAHKMALPSHILAGRFSCKHEICQHECASELILQMRKTLFLDNWHGLIKYHTLFSDCMFPTKQILHIIGK